MKRREISMLEDIIKSIVVETVKLTLREISTTKEKTNSTMNAKEAAEYIGMSINWVYQNLDILNYRKIGRRLSFDAKDLDSFLEERKVKSKNASNELRVKTKIKKTENDKYKVV